MSGYHHTMGEELAHQKSNRRDQQQALMNLAHHYSDASKSARSGELARYGEGERNYRAASSNQRMVDVSANNSKRITKSASGGRLTPEQAEALHQFNKNIQGIAEGPEGWTAEHQTAYIKALAHLRHTPIFAGDPGVLDSHVKSYPVGYKSSKAVILAHDSYHRFLSSIYHAGVVTEMDVKRSHSWLIKNVPEGFRWQFIIPQEGETWQSASQRLNHAEHVRGQKASVPTNGEGPLPPMEPKFDGSEWKATGPIGKAPKGTLPPGRAKG